MLRRAVHGLIAGAAGSALLNITTYLDMLVRGRPSSTVPAETAERLTDAADVSLGDAGEQSSPRRTAAGALLGYGSGVGIGAAYGMAEDAVPDLPLPISGTIVGVAAMLASDIPATATGATDPRRWGAAGWLADLVPHLAFGLGTVAVYRALRR